MFCADWRMQEHLPMNGKMSKRLGKMNIDQVSKLQKMLSELDSARQG